ncbi:MAG: FtsX-like permease family protein [Candidatus Nomurabacteria bacterium]|jgi:hypothetical protein|nr:FtsX-like permease family protein [Candidatus Nomurabacteria bacterium]
MIKFLDATRLARTKLHTHKIRIALSIVIPILLFSAILAGITLFRGFQKTLADFNSEGLSGRFLVGAGNADWGLYVSAVTRDEKLISLIRKKYQEVVEEHKKLAKELDIEYQDSFDPSPIDEPFPGDYYLNTSLPYVLQAKKQIFNIREQNPSDVYRISENYHPKNIWTVSPLYPNNSTFFVMKDGTENYKQLEPREGPDDTPSSFISTGVSIIEDDLAEPFIMSSQKDFGEKVPVILTYEHAERLLGLKSLTAGATSEEKIARMKQVKNEIIDQEITTCFRNSISTANLTSAMRPNEYALVIYEKPAEACGEVTVKKDERTAEQKASEADLAKFKTALGEEVEAWTDELTFVVIGLTPVDDSDEWKGEGLWGIFQKLAGSSLSSSMSVVPRSYLGTNPKFEKLLVAPEKAGKVSGGDGYVLEFSSREDAVNFINEKSNNGEKATAEKPFLLSPYGNNSVVIDELFEALAKIALIALGIAVVISILFLSSTFIKIITNARKEIAVFRAIGFKKSDIVRIYQVYSLIFALVIAISAIVLGLLAACVVSAILSAPLESELMALFSIIDTAKTVNLFTPNAFDILVLLVIVFSTALICSTLPALLAIRRNPIKDLREE